MSELLDRCHFISTPIGICSKPGSGWNSGSSNDATPSVLNNPPRIRERFIRIVLVEQAEQFSFR